MVDTADLKSSDACVVPVRVRPPAPDSIWRQCVTNSVAYRAFPLGNDGSDLDCFTAPESRSPRGGRLFGAGGPLQKRISAGLPLKRA